MLPGMIGAIVGVVLGVLGAAIGIWFSIHNTRSPRERRYMIRWAVAFGLGIGLLLTGLLLLPSPWNLLLWIPYAFLLPLTILGCNRGQARIRAEDAVRSG